MADATRHAGGILLLFHRPFAPFGDASTITEHIDAFGRYSRFPVTTLNTDLGFPRRLAELRFDAIIAHYSLFASGAHPYHLDQRFLSYLDGAEGSYKIAFFQDEHQWCGRRFAFLDRHRFDCVYTLVEPKYFDRVYGRYTKVPKLISHIPAYVSPDMVSTAERLHIPEPERRVDVGYRARPMAPYVGRGGLEKVEIAPRFAERAAGSGLSLDIATREEDRFYGDDWYRFVAGCRSFLGTESGVTCMDLEDEVMEEFDRLAASGPVSVEQLERGAMSRWDGKVPYRTISSRHFECAALRVCQIMYEGEYSGVMEPMRHYIPLKKDFSNFDEVIARFRNADVRRELTGNAYEDLIASGRYAYEPFIADFDRGLEQEGLRPPAEPHESVIGNSLRPSPQRVARRYAIGRWEWLYVRHRRIWRVLHLATRPIAKLVNALAGRGAHPQSSSAQ